MKAQKYQILLENYQKCLLIKEKYRVIEGVINFHQNYFQAIKANPIDYWECLISYYANPTNQKLIGQKTCQMVLQELLEYRNSYNEYYFNNLKIRDLVRKLKKEDIIKCQENITNLLKEQEIVR